MASSVPQLIIISFLISISLSSARTSSKPKALILPLSKDAATQQLITQLSMGTPLASKRFVVDLGGRNLWMECDDGSYISSTFKQSLCGSATCSVAEATCSGGCLRGHHRSGCNNETCWVSSQNTISNAGDAADVSTDTIAIHSTPDGAKSGPTVSISDFIFACSNEPDRETLASGTNGMIGLGRERISVPTQLSSAFGGSFKRRFAICLPSTSKSNGVMFFGDSPYVFYPAYNTSKTIDVSLRFQHIKLYINTIHTGEGSRRGPPSPDYFVKVTSILVNRKPISINSALLEIQINGAGGTKISTVEPYTKLERTIFDSLVKAFDEEMAVWNASKVAPVAPFTQCYSSKNIPMTSGLGLGVPDITFVFDNDTNSYWEMYGANTMVEVSPDVACLAFVDGDIMQILHTPITIGAHQLQDNLLQFDLASNRLAFTSSLQLAAVECSNFKF